MFFFPTDFTRSYLPPMLKCAFYGQKGKEKTSTQFRYRENTNLLLQRYSCYAEPSAVLASVWSNTRPTENFFLLQK
jgi:hypothetical protein